LGVNPCFHVDLRPAPLLLQRQEQHRPSRLRYLSYISSQRKARPAKTHSILRLTFLTFPTAFLLGQNAHATRHLDHLWNCGDCIPRLSGSWELCRLRRSHLCSAGCVPSFTARGRTIHKKFIPISTSRHKRKAKNAAKHGFDCVKGSCHTAAGNSYIHGFSA
jgi:hypothetical protein